jgi:hypothetical protein
MGRESRNRRLTEKSQSYYQRWDPDFDPEFRPPTISQLSSHRAELDESQGFDRVAYRQYEQQNEYTTASYLDLLGTFSNILGMEEDTRDGLLACLGKLIDSQFHGSLVRSDLREMWVAKRVGA